MTLLFSILTVMLAVSFLCSLLEAVFLSITTPYVALQLKENPARGKLLEHLQENMDRPLSAILTMNTIANTAGSSAVGALVHERFGDTGITVLSILLTLIVLTFGEIFPKILGTIYWKTLAPFAAYTIQVYIFLLYPVVKFTEKIGALFQRPEEPEITREEVIATAEIGADEGTLQVKESAIIKNLLMLDKLYVSDIMTPRSVTFSLDANSTVEEVFERHKPLRFSRIPVYEGSLDHPIGMTMRYKIHEAVSGDQHHVKIREITTPLSSVSERMTVTALIDFFIKRKEHVALVTDEYGVITGLVSLEDAIETLLGVEIVDELDQVSDMRQYALEQWQLRKQNIRKP